jgi:hypothetical protein
MQRTEKLRSIRMATNICRGTTLIEMILYIAIVSVLLVGVGSISMSVMDAKSKTRAIGDVFASATKVFGTLSQVVNESSVITTPGLFATSSVLDTTSQIPGIGTEHIELVDGMLFRTSGTNPPVNLTPPSVRVDDLVFSSVGTVSTSTGVRVTLLLSASTTGVWRSFQFSETFTTTLLLGKAR